MYLKKGDKWLVKNYNGYTISNNGTIIITEFKDLSYEITDIKKTSVKNNFVIGFKISYLIEDSPFIEYDLALYNCKTKKAFIFEKTVKEDIAGIDNLEFLCDGSKLRVKFFEASGLIYIADLILQK